MAHLYIIRGLPGSGKSTFAQILSGSGVVTVSVEADMWFSAKEKDWDWRDLKEAHQWCLDVATQSLSWELDVAVSNTFSRVWEMQPYIDYCKEHGHTFTVITCEGNYGNIHNVPEETLRKMKARWEKYE